MGSVREQKMGLSGQKLTIKPDRPDLMTGIDLMATVPGIDPNIGYSFMPDVILAAVNKNLRADPDELHNRGLNIVTHLNTLLSQTSFQESLNFSTRFIKKTDYIRGELSQLLRTRPDELSKIRLELVEKVRPMSKHIGLLRIGSGPYPFFDILFDTSDSYIEAVATVSYLANMKTLIVESQKLSGVNFGHYIEVTK